MFACFDEGCREEGEGEAFGLCFAALGMGLLIYNFCLPDVEGFFKARGVPFDMGWTCTTAFGSMYTDDGGHNQIISPHPSFSQRGVKCRFTWACKLYNFFLFCFLQTIQTFNYFL